MMNLKKDKNRRTLTLVIVSTIVVILFFTGFSIGKEMTNIKIEGNAQIAKPILVVENNPTIDVTTLQNTGFYDFKVKNYNDRSIGEIQVQYKNIVLNPKNINNIVDKGEYKLSVNLLLSDTILNDSILNINNYDIKDKFNEIYNECDKDNVCKDIKYVVSPNNIGKGDLTVLKLETNLKLDDSLYMKKYINSASEFLEKYAYIEYKYLDSKYITYMQAIPVKYKNDEYSYLQVSNNLKYADEIKLILLIRGIKYTIILK